MFCTDQSTVLPYKKEAVSNFLLPVIDYGDIGYQNASKIPLLKSPVYNIQSTNDSKIDDSCTSTSFFSNVFISTVPFLFYRNDSSINYCIRPNNHFPFHGPKMSLELGKHVFNYKAPRDWNYTNFSEFSAVFRLIKKCSYHSPHNCLLLLTVAIYCC